MSEQGPRGEGQQAEIQESIEKHVAALRAARLVPALAADATLGIFREAVLAAAGDAEKISEATARLKAVHAGQTREGYMVAGQYYPAPVTELYDDGDITWLIRYIEETDPAWGTKRS